MRKYGIKISMFLTVKINFESPSFNIFDNTVPSLHERLKKETFFKLWILSKNEVCAKYGTHKRYKVILVTLGPLGPSLRAPLRSSLRGLKVSTSQNMKQKIYEISTSPKIQTNGVILNNCID